ncbi:putative addiction module antidote protein [bacterium]|nr:putative addiction module antidote protein [bacterium]
MRNHRTLQDFSVEYFTKHPDQIDDFIEEMFEDYAEDGDCTVLLSALRIIARVKGITVTADEVGMTRQGLQKALSAQGNPRLDTINAILKALGYRLAVQKLETAHPVTEDSLSPVS